MYCARRCSLPFFAVTILAALGCEREELPSGPEAVTAADPDDVFEEGPFYYFRAGPGEPDIRVPVRIDPAELMVSAASPSDAIGVLEDRGLSVGSISRIPHAGLDHFKVTLTGATEQEVETAGAALRADPRIDFVGHAYTTAGGGHMVLVDRLVVRFQSRASVAEIDTFVDSLGLRVLREADPLLGRPNYWFAYPRGSDPLLLAAEIHTHPLVEWANADKILDLRPTGHVPSDTFYAEQYYLKNSISQGGVPVDINVEGAWTQTKGAGVTVAVIGTGIDGTHSEISGQRASGPCFGGWDSIFASNNANIGSAWEPWGEYCEQGQCGDYEDLHETQVAGIIAAQHNDNGTVGVAPDVDLFSARTHLAIFAGTGAEFAEAIRWAWNDCDADIVNGSWAGSTQDTDIADAIADGVNQGRSELGTVFVFSAGNSSDRASGSIEPVEFPANLATTLAVGAINRWGDVTNYTTRGSELDIVAPSGHRLTPACNPTPGDTLAANVYTLDLWGSDRGCNDAGNHYVRSFSGTSATAPQASGAAALLLATDPNLTESQVRSSLSNNADAWGYSLDYGDGKLNVAAAVGLPGIDTVRITGHSEVPPNEDCTWWADPWGGVSPYSYEWYKDGVPVDSLDHLTINTGTSDFTLKLDVQDHIGNTGSDTKSVTVTSMPKCGFDFR